MLSIGLMSGTSMDGIDAALLDTDGENNIKELGHTKLNYAPEAKFLLKAAERAIKLANGDLQKAALYYSTALTDYLIEELQIDSKAIDAKILQLTAYLQQAMPSSTTLCLRDIILLSTTLHAQAVNQLLTNLHKHATEIDVIGYHGQTMLHNPLEKITVQIGDGALLAALTGISVVNDFRSRDIAAGGQGAPFAPIYHQALAKRDKKIPLVVVNCGGIANISVITSDHVDSLIGFDTGPGNGLIDALIRNRTAGKESMDRDGKYGRHGVVNEQILSLLFEKALPSKKDFFKTQPPKSLDIRDMTLIPELSQLSLEDACVTLEAFTAKAIVDSLDLIDLTKIQIPRHWILAGGGWYNPVIKRELKYQIKEKFGTDVIIETADQAGWNSDAMEAQVFSYFAIRSLKNLPLSVPGTTRVPKPLSGGHAYIPAVGATQTVKTLIAKNPSVLQECLP